MKYLVTGGAGFIGSHLAESLLKQGAQVRILDNLETGKEANIAALKGDIEFIRGDVRDLETCRRACKGSDYVFHEAALGSVPRSIEDPLKTNDVNVTGTVNMLIAARDAGARRFMFASSSSVYGDTPELPKAETMPPRCLSPYALSKYAAETYVSLFYRLYGLETVSLRYFNVFGPRQDPDSQYAAVIPRFVALLAEGKAPVIYGDGEQGRDFTYVSDVVRANMLASTAPREACGGTYNIACNRRTTVNELFERIRALVAERKPRAASIRAVYEPPRTGDIRDSLAAIGEARSKLNFTPAVDLNDGLAKTVESFL